jgi:glycosyltransferase involved in cell wall biosynthesis
LANLDFDFEGLLESASFKPDRIEVPSAWVGHIPFAAWLMRTIRPDIFVELGTHSGNSYLAFCQAAKAAQLIAKCYAVDAWQGDEHSGTYDETVFAALNAYNQSHYGQFSTLMRTKFDDAVGYFADGSIGLLHIDGLHTYEAVRHDFETWEPKLAPGAIVVLHDTNVRERGFGVWRFWDELRGRFPWNVEFAHCHGLGVLCVCDNTGFSGREWLRPNSPISLILQRYFGSLGSRFEEGERYRREVAAKDRLLAEIGRLNDAVSGRDAKIDHLNDERLRLSGELSAHAAELAELQKRFDKLTRSFRWRFLDGLVHLPRSVGRLWRWPFTRAAFPANGRPRGGLRSLTGGSVSTSFAAWYGARPLKRNQLFQPLLMGRSPVDVETYAYQTSNILARYDQSTSESANETLAQLLGAATILEEVMMAARPAANLQRSAVPGRYTVVTSYFAHERFFASCATSVAAMIEAADGGGKAGRVEWVLVNDDPMMDSERLKSLIPPAVGDAVHVISDGLNKGIAARLNQAVAAASHEWILFLDCDDLLSAQAVTVLDHYISSFPQCRYITSTMCDIDEEGEELRWRRHAGPTTMLFQRGMVAGHLKAVRKDLFSELGGLSPNLSGVQDYDFALRAALREPLLQIPEPLYFYRWHPHSQSVSRARRQDRLASAARSARLREQLARPERPPLIATPLADEPRGLCIVRTQGKRLELLAQAVRSVRKQSLSVIPCVVVHGDDAALAGVADWLARESGPLVLLQAPIPNRRRGYPCNVALDYVKTNFREFDFVCFLDDDDYVMPHFAERLCQTLRFCGADVAFCKSNAINTSGETIAMHQPLPTSSLCRANFIPINAYIVSVNTVVDAGVRFDENIDYLEDWDFLLQLLAARAVFTPCFETLSEFRLIGDGNTQLKRNQEHYEFCDALLLERGQKIAQQLGSVYFWRDVLSFPSDRRDPLSASEKALLLATRDLFGAGSLGDKSELSS